MTNFAILSLTENIETLQEKINRVRSSYNSLKDKSSWFASEHEKLLAADLECLAVYKRHLAVAQQSLAVDASPDCQHGYQMGSCIVEDCYATRQGSRR